MGGMTKKACHFELESLVFSVVHVQYDPSMIYNLQNKCRGYQISCVAILELYFLKNLERLYVLEDPPSQRKATMLHYFTAVHLSVTQFLIF